MESGYSQDFGKNIEQARQRASALSLGAGQLASELPNIGNLLRDRATQAYSSNQDIIQPLDKATSTYLTSPQVAREQFQGIFNPFSREKLVAQYTGNQALPMLSLSSILGNRLGRIEDIIGTGTDAFKSQVLAEQSQAETANTFLNSLLQQYQLESDQIYKNRQLALDERKAAQSNQSELGFMNDIIASIFGGYGLGGGQAGTVPSLEDLDEPDPVAAPLAQTVSQPLTATTAPSLWDNILGFFGATPKQEWGQTTYSPLGESLKQYNLGNVPIKFGV